MDALKIALDTLIVGALAAPWLLLIIDFFFPALERETSGKRKGPLDHLLSLLGENSTVATVFLFATAYLLGAGVARVAEDFFNDDDNLLSITEKDIRAGVYCDEDERQVLDFGDIGVPDPVAGKHTGVPSCAALQTAKDRKARDKARRQIEQVFHLEESALLLDGEDKVSTLRHLHQQIMVLRGSAFDGVITCLLCVFAWCATRGLWMKRVLAALPVGFAVYAVYILFLHWGHMAYDDPPSMEIALLAIGVLGCYLLFWKRAQPSRPYLAGFFIAALLAGLAYSGWWRTEILYDRLVINSYYAQSHSLLKTAQ